MRSIFKLALALIALCAAGCADDDEKIRTVGQDVCASERQWVGGNDGSSLMKPGGNCIRCHAESTGAPEFFFAGTVYSTDEADDNCFGVEGATVVVTDDDGVEVEMRTNAAGNFYVETSEAPDLSAPYRARVVYEGREAVMTEPLFSANCVDCHDGSNSGRIPPRMTIPSDE
jgi:mono/diheme cytochrome c family protein